MYKPLLAIAFLWSAMHCSQTQAQNSAGRFQNAEQTADRTTKNYSAFGHLKWKFKTGNKIFSSPAIYHGVAYIGSQDGYLYALSAKSGNCIWRFKTGDAVNSSPTIYDHILYFGSLDGSYYALNAKTGKIIWKFRTLGEKRFGQKGLWTMTPKDVYMEDLYDFFLSSVVIHKAKKGLTAYFGSSDGFLYAVNALNGKKIWSFKTKGIVHTSPTVYQGNLYFGSWDTFLYSLDAENGRLQWKFETGKQPVYHVLEGIQASPVAGSGLIYTGSRDGFFYALDAITGKCVWKYAADNSWVLTTALLHDSSVYIGTSDTYLLLGFNARTGKENLRYKANGYVYSSPAISGHTVFFGDFTGNLSAVDLITGKLTDRFSTLGYKNYAAGVLDTTGKIDFNLLVKALDPAQYATSVGAMNKLYKLGPIVSSPVIADGVIYFGSADGNLYALNLKEL
jgi:outer membrane protein assembly factor BamB